MTGYPLTEVSAGVEPAAPGEFAPLRLGRLAVDPPVVLAPMAGVTNHPFRTLCREHGAGLYVTEMVGARAIVEGDEKTRHLATFHEDERPRSIQLYAVDPAAAGGAVEWLLETADVDHVDLNFGCPAPKVTRHGGGAALPWRIDLFASVISAAVGSAGEIPVTVKMRMGIDDEHHTYLEAGRAAVDAGAAAVALHARTARQLYSGSARWQAIARLKEAIPTVPVLGNGDVWEAHDALRMMRSTGCDGVVVGRGCLGRPWLFRDLTDVFAGRRPQAPPDLGEVTRVMQRHASLLVDWFGVYRGIRLFRKHPSWYLKGFPVGSGTRRALHEVEHLGELDALLDTLDPDLPFPPEALRMRRGHQHGPRPVRLPHGYLRSRRGGRLDRAAAVAVSGG